MGRVLLSMGKGVLILIATFLFIAAVEMSSNNMHAAALVKDIQSLGHPQSSEPISKMAVVENVGGSNDCTWMGGEFRSSPLSREELIDFYSPAIRESYKNANKTLEILFPGDDDPFRQIDGFMTKLNYTARKQRNTTYLLLVTDGAHHSRLDIRCF